MPCAIVANVRCTSYIKKRDSNVEVTLEMAVHVLLTSSGSILLLLHAVQ